MQMPMRQVACVLFDSICAECRAFYLYFPPTIIGPCCSDWTIFHKMSCNRLRMKIIIHTEEEETNTMLLVGRLIGSHREVGRKGEREAGREGGREREIEGVRKEGGME